MTASLTVVGYAVLLFAALALEIVARRWGRTATFAEALIVALDRRPLRVLLQVGWLWIGWHLFVRVDWR